MREEGEGQKCKLAGGAGPGVIINACTIKRKRLNKAVSDASTMT